MSVGPVQWFNPAKGFGFIQPEDGSSDVFVHISAVERAGIGNLKEGQRLSFDVERSPKNGKSSAENLKVAELRHCAGGSPPRASLIEDSAVARARVTSARRPPGTPRRRMNLGRPLMTNNRIGHWAWTLTAEEGLASLVVGRSLRDGSSVTARLKRVYAAMLKKQKKLVARQGKGS